METMQKDLVLAINEYAYVLDKTKGHVSCWVGPCKTSLSTSDELVKFNKAAKKFLPVQKYSDAIHLFTTAPENWYIALKNPAADGRHPNAGGANSNPERVKIGCKVNIPGPCTFALFPGQMAQVIKGHTLRSNQYLLARVYDADALNDKPLDGKNCDTCCDDANNPTQDCKECKTKVEPYVNGQILVIKGTEVSFYIPPTGIEVIPINNDEKIGYVRDAITLERLEYCILKDEDGKKRYVHGPEVVFPEPTETFVASRKGSNIFRAIELSKISGIYVKVIAEYKDEKNVIHPIGEELFITGDDQMIYYPRPEHAIINYDDKIMHHAIAIPAGEGRYIMNRLTGEIKTIVGPAMYLPDPRTEVVVKRKLTENQCRLWYPGNSAVLEYNVGLTEKAVEKSLKSSGGPVDGIWAYATANSLDTTLANLEAKANISRGTSYTKPRTITLDNKLDGVVSVDIWTGYAVNVVSKNGTRKVVCGPQTVLLDYDQTLEVLQMSTGKPKNTDRVEKTVFLRHENNRVSDVIEVETADFVNAKVKVSYLVNFDDKVKNKWFSVDNYVKHLCDWARAKVKEAVRSISIGDFCDNYHAVIATALDCRTGEKKDNCALKYFVENGMMLSEVEALNLEIQRDVQEMIDEHQRSIIERTLDLNAARQSADMEKEIVALNSEKIKLQKELEEFRLQEAFRIEKLKADQEIERAKQVDAEVKRKKEAEAAIQVLKDEIFKAEEARTKARRDAEIAHKKEMDALAIAKEKASAEAMKEVMAAVGPDLAAAMTSSQNEAMVRAIASAVSPYAMANGDSVADAVNTLLRGSSLEDIVKTMNKLRED